MSSPDKPLKLNSCKIHSPDDDFYSRLTEVYSRPVWFTVSYVTSSLTNVFSGTHVRYETECIINS